MPKRQTERETKRQLKPLTRKQEGELVNRLLANAVPITRDLKVPPKTPDEHDAVRQAITTAMG